MEPWGSGNNQDCDAVANVLEEKGVVTIHPTGNSCCFLTVKSYYACSSSHWNI